MVSIVIPVYNVEAYIERCLYSVIQQTYRNIECILVDDCGTDDSCEIAKKFINRYKGHISFSIISHPENLGLAAARNTGIRHANGKYIFFLDSDDAITSDCISTLITLFTKYPNIDFAQGNYLDSNHAFCRYSFNYDIPEFAYLKADIENLILCKIVTSSCNRLILKSFIINNNLYFPVGLLHEDLYWVYFVAKHSKAIAFAHKGTYIYYQNEGSIILEVSKANRIRRYQSRLLGAHDFLKDMINNKSSQYQRQFFAVNLTSCLVELSSLRSLFHWCKFWGVICKISFSLSTKITWNRALFFLCLMPPLCFFSGNKSLRWRIQHRLLSQI